MPAPALPIATLTLLMLTTGAVVAQPAVASRGQLLYETHCIACHTAQVHWREGRLAVDWPALVAQVRRWQGSAQLRWTEGDIDAVARHLNDTIYRLPVPARPVGQGRDAGRRSAAG